MRQERLVPHLAARATISFLAGLCLLATSLAHAASLVGTYRGMEEDRVGEFGDPNPNGREDACFHVTLDTHGTSLAVQQIVLQSADAEGRPAGSQLWDTVPGDYWILGVYRDRVRLNPTDRDVTHTFSGRADYDLYANPGEFKPGQHYRITFRLAGGGEVSTTTRVDLPPARLSAEYLGSLEDRVGQFGDPAPNRETDAHFRFTLDTAGKRRLVKSIVLQSSDAQGAPTGAQRWDTEPGGYWILGVYRDGQRLNPSDQNITHAVEGPTTYEVYANPGSFRPGEHFQAGVRFAEGDEAIAVAKVSVPAARLQATYLGMDQDVVGEFSQAAPNGQADGHFRVMLDTGGFPRRLTEIVLQSADAAGLPAGVERWDTRPGDYWILAVSQDGERLNPTDRDIAHIVESSARYELFANRPGGFRPGDRYRVSVRFAEGDEAVSTVDVGPPQPAPPAPTSPPARPRTLSEDQREVVERYGPPDAFSFAYEPGEGGAPPMLQEEWFHFEWLTRFEFVDGRLVDEVAVEPLPDPSVVPVWYRPEDFAPGMTLEQLKQRFGAEILSSRVEVPQPFGSGLDLYSADQIVFGFRDGRLEYVETVPLSAAREDEP